MNKKFDVVKRDVKLFGRLRKDGTPLNLPTDNLLQRERSVSPLCRLRPHGFTQEPHPLQRLPRPEE